MDLHDFTRLADDISRDEQLLTPPAVLYWPGSTPQLPQGYYICSRCQRRFCDIRSKQAHKCRQL